MTEERMKAWLDGWFFTLDFAQGRTRSTVVPVDYIPSHKPVFYDAEDPPPQCIRKPFMPDDDALILNMREQGVRWKEIARQLKRTVRAVQERYIDLRRERGLDTYTGAIRSTTPMTPAMKGKMLQLRANGWSFGQIARELGVTGNQVADHYNRLVKRMKEKAA